jgi:hypothetical protein
MKPSVSQKQMSPVNIDQNRAVGQDSPAEGSRMGREADKAEGAPGQAEQAEQAEQGEQAEQTRQSEQSERSSREDAIRSAAYEAYQRRGGAPGSETDDWLEAEAELERRANTAAGEG